MNVEEVRRDSIVIEDAETIEEFEELGFVEQSDMIKELTGEETAAVSGYSLEMREEMPPIMEVDYKYLVEKPESPI